MATNGEIAQNQDLACYFVTKNSWKGRYRRVFAVGKLGLSTYNPQNLELTNYWPYTDVVSIMPNAKVQNEYLLVVRKNKKTDTLKFSGEHCSDILSEALIFRHQFAEAGRDVKRYRAFKHHWSEQRRPVVLEVDYSCLWQREPATNARIACYFFKDIEMIATISDYPGAFCIAHGGSGRLHLFASESRDDIIREILQSSKTNVGIALQPRRDPLTFEAFQMHRLGKYSSEEAITSLSEFNVQKISERHPGGPVKRILGLSEYCFIERDPASYNICTVKPLCDVFAVIRNKDNPQLFSLEFVKGQVCHYLSSDRDALLATLLDGVRASGNRDVHVKMYPTNKGFRMGPLAVPVDEEVESACLKFLITPPPGIKYREIIERFNANIPYSGLLHAVTNEGLFSENKEKLIFHAIYAILERCPDTTTTTAPGDQQQPPSHHTDAVSNNAAAVTAMTSVDLESHFHAFRRLVASKAGFAAFTRLAQFRERIGLKVVRALQRNDEAVSHAALDMLCALMQPMHDEYDLYQEQLNKSSLLSSKKFLTNLMDMFVQHVERQTGALIISAMLDFLTFGLCVPYSDTTDGASFDQLLAIVASHGRTFYKLFQHPSVAIVKGAGLIMKALIEEAEDDIANRMQSLALSEGALPRHMHIALFTQSRDGRRLASRQLSRNLIALWMTGNAASQRLLERIIPAGLLAYLDSTDAVPADGADIDRLHTRDNLKVATDDASKHARNIYVQQLERNVERALLHWRRRIQQVSTATVNAYTNMQTAAANHPGSSAANGIVHSSHDTMSSSMSASTTTLNSLSNSTTSAENAGAGDEQQHAQLQQQSRKQRVVILRKRRQKVRPTANWELFFYQFYRDHIRPNLIWDYKTREELREALEAEMHAFALNKELSAGVDVSWNYEEFDVQYRCLSDEIKIGDFYLRVLLEQGGDGDGDNNLRANMKNPYQFFNDLYHRFLLAANMPMRCMCLQAMSIVYGQCFEEIGPFHDIPFVVRMLEQTVDRNERDKLLIFIDKVLMNVANVPLFLNANGIKILVDLLSLAHLHTSRAPLPTQTNVIEAPEGMQADTEAEWFYEEPDASTAASTPGKKSTPSNDSENSQNSQNSQPSSDAGGENSDKKPAASASAAKAGSIRKGPVSFKDLKELYADGAIGPTTRLWAQGMDGWRQLSKVPQLKWLLLASGQHLMDPSRMASHILSTLIRVCRFYPSRDEYGAVMRPIARVKRAISDMQSLPHIVQLLLTFDPILVEKVALLMLEVMRDNPSLPRFYLTGLFFFILMYTGSNVRPVADLLTYAHMRQAFRSIDDMAASAGNELMQRSILGNLLPEAMVCYLENYGAEKFAQVYLGEYDNPEVIWNSDMRRMMIEKIALHISDYTPRLRSNTRALYGYCQIPVIAYPQLESELFCSYYYLRHLCDTLRFPDWPIRDAVKLLKDVLEAWKREVDKKPPPMTVDDALQTLRVPDGTLPGQGDGESVIRKSYFKLAAKYHPDKNPDGREMFEKVSKAYEFLCSRTARAAYAGPDPDSLQLIMKTQCLVFSRYRDVLAPYKYAGYPMLIKTIQMETTDAGLFSKPTPLLPVACEVAYHTVNCSALNAEELRREDGLEQLYQALERCSSVVGASSKPEDMPVQVCINVIRCYAVAAQFPACRKRLSDTMSAGVVRALCQLLSYKHLPRLAMTVVQCVAALAVDAFLQDELYKAGVLYPLLLNMFRYDYTLVEGGVEADERNNRQHMANVLALESLYACTRLAGIVAEEADQTPANPVVQTALEAMLMHYVLALMQKQPRAQVYPEILKLLNSNIENPYMLWNNGLRAELLDYIEREFVSQVRTGQCDPALGIQYKHSVVKDELVVGDIFLRVYNDQPTFPIEEPRKFTLALLDFLGSQAQYLYSVTSLNSKGTASPPGENPSISAGEGVVNSDSKKQSRFEHARTALESLRNVMRANKGVEVYCIGHFRLLFSLLRLPDQCRSMQMLVLEVILCVTSNRACVDDIAASDVIIYLLLSLHILPEGRMLALESLHALTSNTKIIKDCLQTGGIIYLLDIFCNGLNMRTQAVQLREKTAELLAKMIADKLHGPRVRLVLQRFLPSIFLDAVHDSAEQSVIMFDGVHENPELVWNDASRELLCRTVAQMRQELFERQVEEPTTLWQLPENFTVPYENAANGGEVVVAGVYLRLFNANPGWILRRPKEFLLELLDRFTQQVADVTYDERMLKTITDALVGLLQAQPALANPIPSYGHMPQIFAGLKRDGLATDSCLRVLYCLVDNQICASSMSSYDCIAPVKYAISRRIECVGLAAETLNRLFSQNNTDALVQQALNCELVEELLRLLDSSQLTSATKALIVKALKAMQRSLRYGEQVQNILDRSEVWLQFRDQKHDLFLTSSKTAGYLTQGLPSVAGYLTAGPSSTNGRSVDRRPPPMTDGAEHVSDVTAREGL